MNPTDVKKESERIIQEKGGKTIDWLPTLERMENTRSNNELIDRALILNALINIYFEAPIPIIKGWIEQYGLTPALTEYEQKLLNKENKDLNEQEKINIYWNIEALWALMWAGNLIDDLPIDKHVEDYQAELCPNLQVGEDDSRFRETMRIRPKDEIFKKLDLYFRTHWHTRNGKLNGYSTGEMDDSIVLERRKALEWLMDNTLDWDNIPLNT